MKAKPYRQTESGYEPCEPTEATHIELNLPGPMPYRMIPVMIGGTRHGTGNWTWNGSTESPTIKPSVLTRGGDESGEHRCHSFINDGKVLFLPDCSHEFAGRTMDLLDVEDK